MRKYIIHKDIIYAYSNKNSTVTRKTYKTLLSEKCVNSLAMAELFNTYNSRNCTYSSIARLYVLRLILDVLDLVTQVDTSIVLCYLLNAKKNRTTFVLTCITK